jgi:hypothetical protein
MIRRLAPALVAAAVVAVVVPTFTLLDRPSGQAVPLQRVGEPVVVNDSEAVNFQAGDAGLPASAGAFPPNPDNVGPCDPGQLTAVLDLASEQVRVEPRQNTVCLLPPDSRVELPPPVSVVLDLQTAVPNPPVFGGRLVQSGGIAFNADWSGRCDVLPSSGSLVGVGLRVPLPVTGTPPSCGAGGPMLRVGPAHAARRPGAVVPADRAGLAISLQLPTEVSSGKDFTYDVVVANPSEHTIALRPCPTFSATFRGPTGGSGGGGRLPCDRLPGRLEARTKLVLVMHVRTSNAEPTKTEIRAEGNVRWGIAGTPEATGTLSVVQHAPEQLPAVPYLAPTGQPPAKSSFRYPGGNGAFAVILAGPARVRVGDTLRYRAVFTNPEGGPVVPLTPCPAWTELLAQAPKVTNRPDIVERTGAVNCAQAPAKIGPGQQIAFEMERVIGPDTPPGAYQLYWQIHNGLVSAPFDLEIVP